MSGSRGTRRPFGTGALFIRTDTAGHETWYGKWRVGQRQVKRRLGRRRAPGSSVGLSRRQAEARLQEAITLARSRPIPEHRVTLREAAEQYVQHLAEVVDRKPSTVEDYRSILRRHFVPYFGDDPLEKVTADVVSDYAAAKRTAGLAPKTVLNHLRLLNAIFVHAVKRGWAAANPVAALDRPRPAVGTPDLRFLTQQEVDDLIRAVPDDALGPVDRALYITAALTGLRQGELVALRWRDVDWDVGLVRVRRTYTRGRFGTPKSARSSRSVPMADAVAEALRQRHADSRFTADDGLVFGHPIAGGPYDASQMRKRFYAALERAGVRRVRFHDLRHTFGTRMAAAGAPLRAIQEWMGHANYQTTLVYADYAPDPSQGTVWAKRAFGASADDDE